MAKKKKSDYEWRNFSGAQEWVNKEYGDATRGKTMTSKRQKKLLDSFWRRAKRKDMRGEF